MTALTYDPASDTYRRQDGTAAFLPVDGSRYSCDGPRHDPDDPVLTWALYEPCDENGWPDPGDWVYCTQCVERIGHHV